MSSTKELRTKFSTALFVTTTVNVTVPPVSGTEATEADLLTSIFGRKSMVTAAESSSVTVVVS